MATARRQQSPEVLRGRWRAVTGPDATSSCRETAPSVNPVLAWDRCRFPRTHGQTAELVCRDASRRPRSSIGANWTTPARAPDVLGGYTRFNEIDVSDCT